MHILSGIVVILLLRGCCSSSSCLCQELLFFFLDTKCTAVSPAPTHVSWLVAWLVRSFVGPSVLWSVRHTFFTAGVKRNLITLDHPLRCLSQKTAILLECMKASMLKNVYEGLNALSKVYLSKEYFCKMYPTCVSSKLCKYINLISGGHVGVKRRAMKLDTWDR